MKKIKGIKIGGAVNRTPVAVKHLPTVLNHLKKDDKDPHHTIITLSALGNTTNRLEEIFNKRSQRDQTWEKMKHDLKKFHTDFMLNLGFTDSDETWKEVIENFGGLRNAILTSKNDDKSYALIVSYGELFATLIVAGYLKERNFEVEMLMAPTYIKTDENYRNATVNLEKTAKEFQFKKDILQREDSDKPGKCIVTQGFIGSTKNNPNNVTTLGREGSDYTAGVLGNIFDQESVTLFKDVDGVSNYDPKIRRSVKLEKFDHLTYDKALELIEIHNAKIIHPKALQILKEKNIPLIVRSYLQLDLPGTRITAQVPVLKNLKMANIDL